MSDMRTLIYIVQTVIV